MKARSAHAATVMSLCNIRTSYPSGSHRDSSVALKGKAARRWLFNLNLLIGVQAAINAGFDLPRQVMKPIPAKNRQGFVWPAIGIVLDAADEFNNCRRRLGCYLAGGLWEEARHGHVAIIRRALSSRICCLATSSSFTIFRSSSR